MQDPNILQVLDSGRENGTIYLISPYMENGSVAEHGSTYKDPQQALGLIEAIVSGLKAIYGEGYVHGNLQPTNIMLDSVGRPLLADFAVKFQPGEMPTPYNSPEQVSGGVVDQRSDVYALGVLLYTLLVGQAPAPGTVVNLQAARPDVTQAVEQVILKAMAQNPDQRYQTPSEFNIALKNALHQAPPAMVAPAPAATPAQPQAPAQKGTNWMGIALGALLVLVMCLCLAWVGPRVMEYLNPTQPASVQPIQPQEQPPEQPAEQPPEQPAEQPPEQPAEQPPADQSSAPEQLPAGDEGGLNICNSLGLAGGIVLMGGALKLRRRKRG
jgi:serine/threonine protein kinase